MRFDDHMFLCTNSKISDDSNADAYYYGYTIPLKKTTQANKKPEIKNTCLKNNPRFMLPVDKVTIVLPAQLPSEILQEKLLKPSVIDKPNERSMHETHPSRASVTMMTSKPRKN